MITASRQQRVMRKAKLIICLQLKLQFTRSSWSIKCECGEHKGTERRKKEKVRQWRGSETGRCEVS